MPADPALAWMDRFVEGERNGVEHQPAAWSDDLGTHEWVAARAVAAARHQPAPLLPVG